MTGSVPPCYHVHMDWQNPDLALLPVTVRPAPAQAGDRLPPRAGDRLPLQTKTARAGVIGAQCHICRSIAPAEMIAAVGHWICIGCQDRFMDRGIEFLRVMVQGESLDCCGPLARL